MPLFFAEIDLRKRSIHWVRAGHEPALLYESLSGEFTELMGLKDDAALVVAKMEP